MKITIQTKKEVEVKTLAVSAGVRYWEDATVNGVEDTNGDLIPCREDDYWCPNINVNTGQILNWKQGVKAAIHYKVCDDGAYDLQDEYGNHMYHREGYVPSCMYPDADGFGDYIILSVDENGFIQNWQFDPEDFIESEVV